MAVNIGPKIGIDGEAQYRKELNSIIQQAKTLASEMKAVTSAFDKNDNSQAKLTAQTRVLTQQIEVQRRRVEQLQKGLDAAAKKYGETDSRTLKWKQAVNDATAELNRMQVELKQTTNETDDLGDELESAGRQVSSLGDIIKGSFLGNLMADAVSNIVSELGNLVSEGAKAADALTKFRSTMDFAGYDAATIEETADAMQDYASRTVYDLQTVANTTAQLAANSVPDFEALTEAAGNLNAVAGGNADTFKSVSMVLTQTAGAGKLTTENWNQLADAIPGASGVLQQAMLENGAYVGNFREAMENGEISAEEFNAAIMQLGSSDEAVKAAQSVSIIEGAVGNLQASVTDFFTAALTQGGLMQVLTDSVNSLTTAFSNFASGIDWSTVSATVTNLFAGLQAILLAFQPVLDQVVATFINLASQIDWAGLGTMIVNAFTGAADIMGRLWPVVDNLVTTIVDNWQTILSAVTGIGAAWQALKLANAIKDAGSLVNLIKQWTNVTKLQQVAQAALNVVMNANPIMLVVSLIAGLVAAFVTAYTTSEDFRNTVNSVFQSVKQAASDVVDAIVNFFTVTVPNGFSQFVSAATNKFNQFKTMISNIVLNVKQFFSNLLSSIQSTANNIGTAVQNGLNSAISFITSLPGRAVQWGLDFINGLASGVVQAAKNLLNSVRDIADQIASFLHFSRPDEGPLREYETWMPDFMKGLARGIDANAWRVDDALGRVSNMMVFRPEAYATQAASSVSTPGGTYAGQPISITVNAAPGQDENYIAELVMQKIQAATARKEATWGR